MGQEGGVRDGPQVSCGVSGRQAIMEASFGQHGVGDTGSTETGREECRVVDAKAREGFVSPERGLHVLC